MIERICEAKNADNREETVESTKRTEVNAEAEKDVKDNETEALRRRCCENADPSRRDETDMATSIEIGRFRGGV